MDAQVSIQGRRRPVAFFDFTPDDLTDENIDATAERVANAIQERSQRSSSPEADDTDQDSGR